MVANKKVIDSRDISDLFGLNSKIFRDLYEFLENQSNIEDLESQKRFNRWKSTFFSIYGEDVDKPLFLKHSYFILLLRVITNIKFGGEITDEVRKNKGHNDKFDVNQLFFPEVENFFLPEISKELFNKIASILNDSLFAHEDLFQRIYQQIFLIITRHKIGEFYTPSPLVKKMLEKTYKFGLKTLDPACGSGSFIIEIINKILNSELSNSLKVEAIEKVYGFDINPLATLTTKVNIVLLLEKFANKLELFPAIHIHNIDGLFPENSKKVSLLKINEIYNSFDLVIGNPPWLTYKDLVSKEHQTQVRLLAEELDIKPPSQYITHIELGSIFFYASAIKYLKINGVIFFVITKSILNGDHCYKFRAFTIFKNIEIWDFPESYFFNVQHICLKAQYIGKSNQITIHDKYPIKTTIVDNSFEDKKILYYSSLKLEEKGAKIILPESELRLINSLSESDYKRKFFQGATLVPKTLIYFKVEQKLNNILIISSDPEILKRAKKKWKFQLNNQKIEDKFSFKTFLNRDMVPFYIKQYKRVFLPINAQYELDNAFLKENPLALEFYNKINRLYQENKKQTSKINTLFANLNYWNKLTKQKVNKAYIVTYNASGSNLKAAVIDNSQENLIISSEDYYYSTDSINEASYLSAVLNTPLLSKYMKLIKSSRHIHKRPFSFPIPAFDKENPIHRKLANKGQKYYSVVQDLVANNQNISSEKVRIFIHQKLTKLNELVKDLMFKL
ncbi:MAG: hypothetical protein EAX89_12645 [Candidatus Lokiarchaeota archaeon]|nr:hypothetical protein [Candidatus Lokiarchaeota archaeon]